MTTAGTAFRGTSKRRHGRSTTHSSDRKILSDEFPAPKCCGTDRGLRATRTGAASNGPDVRQRAGEDVLQHSDVIEARFVRLRPDELIVLDVEFASDRPEFAGTMTMTWSLSAKADGTDVSVIAGMRARRHQPSGSRTGNVINIGQVGCVRGVTTADRRPSQLNCCRAPSERASFGHNFLQTHNECAFSLR